MDEAPILSSDRERKVFDHVVALHGGPAFLRRAQNVQLVWDSLVEQCRRQREEWLGTVRTRLGILRGLAGEWAALAPLVADAAQLDVLAQLERDLRPQIRSSLVPTTSLRTLRRALLELNESLAFFNQRWQAHLARIDLTELNRLREDYNRYYILEKECAVRSPVIARQGFRPLPPATLCDLASLLPVLSLPAVLP
jgi:hypothetical protein